jgi:FAD/FMN-containing dehydrogenase
MRDDPAARAVYSEAAGIARVLPRAVAQPRTVEEVAALVRWAADARLPLVPRGSGSGMAGGAVGDGVVADLTRLRSLEIDAAGRRARAGPGVTRGALDAVARRHGLWLPVDPSSGAFCSLGGMAATNAAGARTLKHGAMRRWVTSLECVFADGSRALVRRSRELPSDVPALARFAAARSALRDAAARLPAANTRKDSSLYGLREFAASGELCDLLVGSEGTLALFTALEIPLIEVPGATATVLAAYTTLESAVQGAAIARQAAAAACELLDRTFLEFAASERALPVDSASEAVLLMELDAGDGAAAAAAATSLGDALRSGGAASVLLGIDDESADAFWALRHAASPILQRLPRSLQSMQFIEDCAVPPDTLPQFVRGLRAALDRQHLRGVIFGHAGDAHVHVNPLIDMTRPDWKRVMQELLDDVVDLTARCSGTLSGEHGDGRVRTPLLARVRSSAEIDLARRVKEIFDPESRLNPGVKVPLPGQRAIPDIKYDDALPPLPDAARRVLDRVTLERAYDRNRLEMLDEAR